jgi:hypothetical protein
VAGKIDSPDHPRAGQVAVEGLTHELVPQHTLESHVAAGQLKVGVAYARYAGTHPYEAIPRKGALPVTLQAHEGIIENKG